MFDCNIFLDAASLLGPPFAWDKFDAAIARTARDPLPHPKDRAYDSLRAIAVCTSGRFAGEEVVEVWTCSHVDKLVRGKAKQPANPDPMSGYRGLGWSAEEAQTLVDELIYGLVERSDGGTIGDPFPDGNPPLDHEDGKVYGACKALAWEDPLAQIYCVTRDRGFLQASQSGSLSGHTRVLSPSTFVALVRAARAQYSMRKMTPPRPSAE
jgi:hypothetical protein